jgi:hypothetical protein
MNNDSIIVKGLLNRWANDSDEDIKLLWSKVRYNVWTRRDENVMVTLQWTPFELDIATFVLPKTMDEDPNTDQMLVFNEPDQHPLLIPKHKFKEGDLATVPEVVDAFLSGQWTPHWRCHTCRKRMTNKIKPV